MEGDEPIGGDDIIKEELSADELVEVITEPAIGQPTVEEEAPMREEEKRKALYNVLAEKMPLVQEAVGGYTTFREALDEIVYELGHPQENSGGVKQFGEYITALALLAAEVPIDGEGLKDIITSLEEIDYEIGHLQENSTDVEKFMKYVDEITALTVKLTEYVDAMTTLTGETPVDAEGLNDITTYHHGNTERMKKGVNKITLRTGVYSGLWLGAGFVLERWFPELALAIKLSGATGLGAAGTFRGIVGAQNRLKKRKANKHFASLYEIADSLDAEVQSLYVKEG